MEDERKLRNYRIREKPYRAAMKRAKQSGTTLSKLIERSVIKYAKKKPTD